MRVDIHVELGFSQLPAAGVQTQKKHTNLHTTIHTLKLGDTTLVAK